MQHEGSIPSLTAFFMIIEEQNFISDFEHNGLLSILDRYVQDETFDNNVFYKWYEISTNDPLRKLKFIENLVKKHFELLSKKVEKRTWKINYMGFAYQTAGFPYHADSMWPADDSDRYLGDPSHNDNNFINYEGEWVPNYVPTRLFTTVLYLNQVEGGETDFPALGIRLTPEPKKIVGFHCDENHIHGVMPTTFGVRKAFIIWYE